MNKLRYIALLRGINVGGNILVKMDKLKEIFESMGLTNIKSVLASGNIVFDIPEKFPEKDLVKLTQKIEAELEKATNHKIPVILRTNEEIQSLLKSEPFKDIQLTPSIRLHVTFIKYKDKSKLISFYSNSGSGFTINQISTGEVCSNVNLSSGKGTVDLMKLLETEFSKNITTRSWDTVLKIGKILE